MCAKSIKPESEDPESKKNEKIDEFYNSVTSSTRDVIGYVILIFGIILLFFYHIYGELLVGVVLGAYFSKEILHIINNYDLVVAREGYVRSLILGGVVLAFFIVAPAIFLGAALTIALKIFILDSKQENF